MTPITETNEYNCPTCRDTGYVAIPGTAHIGPDGWKDWEIEPCEDCK